MFGFATHQVDVRSHFATLWQYEAKQTALLGLQVAVTISYKISTLRVTGSVLLPPRGAPFGCSAVGGGQRSHATTVCKFTWTLLHGLKYFGGYSLNALESEDSLMF